ncbi:MAG: hemolysin D [Rhodospirillaceae bacterium]|nr:hemolysin D [Rhodospirillaceae bacterium]
MKLRTALFTAVLGAALLLAGVFGVSWWLNHRHLVTTDNAYVKASITVISPKIEGYVEEVDVLSNTPVRKGELLVKFDAEPFEAAVAAARADVESAQASIAAAEAEAAAAAAAVDNARDRYSLQKALIRQDQASVEAARARAEQAARDLDRYQSLLDRKVGTEQRYEQAVTEDQLARAERQRAQAALEAGREQLSVLESEIKRLQAVAKQAEAQVAQAKAQLLRDQARLEQAEIELSHTNVVSPIDGVAGNRIVEPGVYMEAGWPMVSIVPLDGVWVVANFKETQLTDVRVGQTVTMTVDAFPGVEIVGRVLSLAPASASEFSLLPPQNASGNFVKVVQRVPVKITFDIPDEILGRLVPGMSVIATIDTASGGDGAALASARD